VTAKRRIGPRDPQQVRTVHDADVVRGAALPGQLVEGLRGQDHRPHPGFAVFGHQRAKPVEMAVACFGLAAPGIPAPELRRWLDTVGLDEVALDASAGRLSGGQQKRVALLRALLRGKDLVVLDEPTSGLDPASTGLVANLIRQQLDQHAGALLMVTHDYAFALTLCDRFWLLSDGRLIDVTPAPGTPREAAKAALHAKQAAHPGAAAPVGGEALAGTWGFGRLLARYLWEGAPLVLGAMVLVGAMLVAQLAHSGPFDISRYVPGITVESVLREFAPLVVGFLLAARIGTRIAAQVAGMSYTAQLDSMRVLGISPLGMLLLPSAAAAALVFPICVLAGGLVAVLTGAAVVEVPWLGISIGARRFLDLAADAFELRLAVSGLIKGALTGLAVAVIGYRAGSRPIHSAPLLGSAVTGATVGSAVAVVLIDVVISWIFFTGGRG